MPHTHTHKHIHREDICMCLYYFQHPNETSQGSQAPQPALGTLRRLKGSGARDRAQDCRKEKGERWGKALGLLVAAASKCINIKLHLYVVSVRIIP